MPHQNKKQGSKENKIDCELMREIVKAYQACDQPSLRSIAVSFHMTVLKVRKVLITADVYETPVSRKVSELWSLGRSIPEIQEQLGLSRASVHSYLPYTKTIYKQEQKSPNGGSENLYRERQKAVENIKEAVGAVLGEAMGEKSQKHHMTQDQCMGPATDFLQELEALVWDTLFLFQSCPFQTAKKLEYTYSLKGNEMFVSRKDKSITRATAALALQNALCILREGGLVDGPKKLKTFGASYLYPVFIRIGIIPQGIAKKELS